MRPRYATFLVAVALTACENDGQFRPGVENGELPAPRPVESDTYTDVLVQSVQPVVDVLFVIDNSCSMSNDQAALSENAPAFMQWFVSSGLDYHIGVVSTDVVDSSDNGRLQAPPGFPLWIDSSDNDAINTFSQMAVLGSFGASPERGLDGLYRAIEVEGRAYNNGFLRQDSNLNVIVVSDEDDFSMDVSPPELVRWFGGLRPDDQLTFSAIDNPLAGESGPGRKYRDIAENFAGEIWDINQDDWATVLERLGLQATGRRAEFFLSRNPVQESIEVQVQLPGTKATALVPPVEFDAEGLAMGAGWAYVPIRNTVLFYDYVPPELAVVRITYELR